MSDIEDLWEPMVDAAYTALMNCIYYDYPEVANADLARQWRVQRRRADEMFDLYATLRRIEHEGNAISDAAKAAMRVKLSHVQVREQDLHAIDDPPNQELLVKAQAEINRIIDITGIGWWQVRPKPWWNEGSASARLMESTPQWKEMARLAEVYGG